MNVPKTLLYTESHEWIEKLGEGKVRIGLTDYAQSELGDLVFVSLPAAGDALEEGATFADVESVKAVSEVYSPVNGTVDAVNEILADEPEKINADSYAAWLVEASGVALPDTLLSAEEYEALVAKEG